MEGSEWLRVLVYDLFVGDEKYTFTLDYILILNYANYFGFDLKPGQRTETFVLYIGDDKADVISETDTLTPESLVTSFLVSLAFRFSNFFHFIQISVSSKAHLSVHTRC